MSGTTPGAAIARIDADPRPWLEFYPPGVPAEIDPARAGTLERCGLARNQKI